MSVDHAARGDIIGVVAVDRGVFKVGIRVGIVAGSKVDWRRCSLFRGSVGQSDDFPFLVFLLMDFANLHKIPEGVVEIKTGDGIGIGVAFVFGFVSVVRHLRKLVGVVFSFLAVATYELQRIKYFNFL